MRFGWLALSVLVALVASPSLAGEIDPPGATTVLIDGQPAARAGDAVSGIPNPAPPPDTVSGTIVEGERTVLIEGQPAAVVGSPVSPEGSVEEGATTVLIGGKPAARVGDPTVP